MRNTITALIVMVALLVGVLIGLVLGPRIERDAYAQAATPATATPSCVSSATVECVTPTMTVGSAGIGRLLSNQISADQLTVNGYDILKLDNNLLSALVQGGVITQKDAQALAEGSRADKVLRFQPYQAPTPPTQQPKP